MKTLLLLLFFISSLSAAVNGSPLTTQPGPQPQLWMETANDNFLPHQTDDNLTAEWKGGFTIDKYLVGGFSYDMLTEKNYNGINKTGIREDELTLVVGPHPYHYTLFQQHITIQLAAGSIADGDLGGKTLQNSFHKYTDENPIDAHYDNERAKIYPLVLADVRDLYKVNKNLFIEAQCQGETNDYWQKVVVSFLPYFTKGQFTVFLGPTFQHSLNQLSTTSGIVDKKYDGIGVLGGVRVSGFYITSYYNHSHIGNLALGVESKL
jgi:hypothetical protein